MSVEERVAVHTAPARRDGVPRLRSLRERQLALVVLCAGTLMIILDSSVVNVALPSIQEDLGFSQSNLAWVVNAYLIPFGGLLLLAGRLGDLFGRKRLFMAGLGLFTVASLFCGLAESQELLIGARFVQGIGGAMASAVVLGMVVTMFPKPKEQARAIGVYAFVASSGAAIGLLAGAALTSAINWHWIFFVNLPIGVVTMLFAARLIDENRANDVEEGLDVTGGVLITASLMLWVYAIVQAVDNGWTSARTLSLGAVTIALLAGFVVRQARARNPLVPLGIFRARNVGWANLIQVLMVAGLAGLFFIGALYMQLVLRFSVAEIGLAFLPVAVVIAVLSLKLAPKLIGRVDARTVLVPGLLLIAGGLVFFARVPVDGSYLVDVLPVMLLLGTGAGLCFPAVLTVAMADATSSDAGVRSGLVSTTQQIGPALGLAVLAALSSMRTETSLASGQPVDTALASGYRLAFLIAAGFVLVAVVLSLTVLRPAVPRTAPTALDHARIDDRDEDLTGVHDPDFLALGLGGTNMMAMLWSVAMGRRAVGVDLRGDPSYGVMHWNLREDLYHHLGVIDQLMLQRYGEDGVPRRGDGSLFRLGDCLYGTETASGDVSADEMVAGFDLEAHLGSVIRHSEFVDDRWRDGEPHRAITDRGPAQVPTVPDPQRIGAPMIDVLRAPPLYQAGAEELLILLRRYLEKIERMDLERGVENPRVRLFTHRRVITPADSGYRGLFRQLARWFALGGGEGDGFVDGPDGRKRVRIEAVREIDHKGKFRRIRAQGTKVIDIGVPELFVVAQGIDSKDARRLGFEQQPVMIDHQDGRGPVVAQADYVSGLIEILVDSRLRRRIASEFDKEGTEYWVRQIAVGHEDDAEVGWVLVEVPDFKTFDPVLAGLVRAGTARDSSEYFAAYQHLLRDFFLEQAAILLEVPKAELVKVQLTYGPKLFRLVERVGTDALVAANGVVAGDSFGNGHVVTSDGAMTGMIGHASRVLRYWQSRDAGATREDAIRWLADGIREDTQAWLEVSSDEFRQPVPNVGPERLQKLTTTIEATRRHRRSHLPSDYSDEWTRLLIQAGRLHAYPLPPLQDTHPASRSAHPEFENSVRSQL